MNSKIPIKIAPFYWVSSLLIAYINTQGSPNFWARYARLDGGDFCLHFSS